MTIRLRDKPSLATFLDHCSRADGVDRTVVAKSAVESLAFLRRSADGRAGGSRALEDRWYASLAAGAPDYGVYDTDEYLGELWACWITYSRKYLLGAFGARFASGGLLRALGPVESVLDLGCGVGYACAALRAELPHARVVGTNIRGTNQWRIAQTLAVESGFALVDALDGVGPVDVVFASEFFEHLPRPVAYLGEVVERTTPRALLVANTFNAASIGHFRRYDVDGAARTGTETSRAFDAALRRFGYEKVKTGLWNQRPAFWTRAAAASGSLW